MPGLAGLSFDKRRLAFPGWYDQSQLRGEALVKIIVQVIAAAGVLAMAGAIGYAFVAGDFGAEGAILTSMPWGIVSLVDLYVGFVLFSVWVVYREPSRLAAAGWVLVIMLLGNLATAAYVLWALGRSGADARRFFFGARA